MSDKIFGMFERTPIALVAIGVILVLIGALGGVPIGSQLQIVNPTWGILLAIIGGVFIVFGLVLILIEAANSNKGKAKSLKNDVQKFNTPGEALSYILQKMKVATKGIYDLTWEKPLE